MHVIVVGASHKTAPVEVREALAVAPEDLPRVLDACRREDGAAEAVVLSTCNRVEIYAAVGDAAAGGEALARRLQRGAALPAEEILPRLYRLVDGVAVRHLFRVAAGLDSLVVGESEILGQAKEAYLAAVQRQATGGLLNPLFQRAFRAAKEVRSRTAISQGRVSVGSVAVELAAKIFGSLAGQRVLVVGAGEMAERTLEHLSAQGVSDVTVCNRSADAGEALAARVGGRRRPFAEREAAAAEADIVISSTAAPGMVFTRESLARALERRRHRPLLVIDIAVPRDVDPAAADLADLFLYDIDDLEAVVSTNLTRRAREIDAAERIVSAHAADFEAGFLARDWEALIKSLQAEFERIGLAEMRDLWRRSPDVPPERRREVEATVRRLLDRIADRPAESIRVQIEEGDGRELVRALKTLFRLP